MNFGQILLLILALALFMTVVNNFNQVMILKTQNMYALHTDSNGLALGQYLLDQVWTKNFDAEDDPEDVPADFTSQGSFGHNSSEHFDQSPFFNDVDDYHKLDATITFAGDNYKIKGRVYYSNAAGDSVGYNTIHKVVVFDIENPVSEKNVTVTQMFSYVED